MGIITVTQKGSFNNTERYLQKVSTLDLEKILNKYGLLGVKALSEATPKDSGLTAQSWYYEIVKRPGYCSIRWRNSNIQDGVTVAILLQYGHGTRQGGWVEGINYIPSAIQPVFDKILADATEEVTK